MTTKVPSRGPLKRTVNLMKTKPIRHALWLACFVVFAGCGRGSDVGQVDVSGKATFDGQPIVYGQIDFTPDRAKGHEGPAGYAEIVNGHYDTAGANGRGVVPGPHVVRITAYPEPFPEVEVPDEEAAATGPTALFIGYTVEQNVESGTLDINVPAAARGHGVSK